MYIMVTHKLHMDLCGHEVLQWVHVVQGDVGSRNLEIALYQGVLPWQIPEDVTVLIRYRKADKAWGEYDTQPDGTCAWSVQGNVLNLALSPQITAEPGTVRLSVCLLREGVILNTFPLEIVVAENLALAEGVFRKSPDNYIYLTAYMPAPEGAREGQYVRIAAVDENGKVTAVETVDISVNGGTGETVDEAVINRMVENYLAENPPEVAETDPTVPAWAKQPEKPGYTAEEVGALPVGTLIPTVPTKVSAFQNDAGYLTEHQDLSGYAKTADIPTRPEDIGAQPAGDYALRSEVSAGSVQSVNGRTGEVILTAGDVGALPEDTVIPVVPESLKNPYGLTFTGAVAAAYDGSGAVSVEIPDAYSKTEIDAIMGAYIHDIDALVGGDG